MSLYAMKTSYNQCLANFVDSYKGFDISVSFDKFNDKQSTRGEIRVFQNGNDVTHLFSRDGVSMFASIDQIIEIRQKIDGMQE